MLRTLHVERLSQGVVNGLLAAIREGQFSPGDRLPSERRLAEEFGVSRASVREGLRVLELMEAIEVRQGRGAIVLEGAGRPTGQLLRSWLRSHHDEVLELLEVREALEASAAAFAASKEGPALRPDPPATDGAELDALVAADVAFHDLVADRSGNEVLAGLVHELNGVLEPSRYAMFSIPGRHERSHHDHLEIAEAINAGDAAKAAEAMRRHILQTRKEIEMHITRGSD